jgi:ectoine hydroxylase-related dioxygenase (phytanoyl-CoA dioxygenase family)
MTTANKIGWAEKAADDPEVVRLRDYLSEANGIKNLQTFKLEDLDGILKAFHRDGFAVVTDVLTPAQIDQLADGCNQVVEEVLALDDARQGNRGSHRYSFGGSSMTRSQLHRPAWQMLLQLPAVTRLMDAVFGSEDYLLRAASGDFCLPGAVDYQPLHSDVSDWRSAEKTPFSAYYDPSGAVTMRDLPVPYVCMNFLPQDVTPINGPTRQIPGTQKSRAKIPRLEEEPEWMRLSTVCPAPAGSVMIRDVRAWHGGTPNLSDATRAIPNLEFYAPWFREPMVPGISYQDFKALTPRAQKMCQFSVADSSETLDTRTTLRAP